MEENKKTQKRQKRAPKRISQSYLENSALFYLERYATSSSNFRNIMMRKIKRSCEHHQTNIDDFVPLLDKLIERYKNAGLLNDEVFARGKVESLRRKGLGERAIIAKLQEKGLKALDIKKALEEIDEDKEDAELEAACTFVKKKKLGRYRTNEPKDAQKQQQRELASMARAGFSYDIAKKVLNFNDEEYDI